MSCSDRALASPGNAQSVTEDDEVAPDAMQLLEIANFNGLCRVIAALAHNGLISRWQIENIHDCMTAPLDDPDWRDYSFIADTREVLENVLSFALKEAKSSGSGDLVIDN